MITGQRKIIKDGFERMVVSDWASESLQKLFDSSLPICHGKRTRQLAKAKVRSQKIQPGKASSIATCDFECWRKKS